MDITTASITKTQPSKLKSVLSKRCFTPNILKLAEDFDNVERQIEEKIEQRKAVKENIVFQVYSCIRGSIPSNSSIYEIFTSSLGVELLKEIIETAIPFDTDARKFEEKNEQSILKEDYFSKLFKDDQACKSAFNELSEYVKDFMVISCDPGKRRLHFCINFCKKG